MYRRSAAKNLTPRYKAIHKAQKSKSLWQVESEHARGGEIRENGIDVTVQAEQRKTVNQPVRASGFREFDALLSGNDGIADAVNQHERRPDLPNVA